MIRGNGVQTMNVSVIGTGYVGLTTGVSLAFLGHRVTCVDVDAAKIDGLRRGEIPIHEPGLRELMELSADRLTFTMEYGAALKDADVLFFAVGTPAEADGSPNLGYLYAALHETLQHAKRREAPLLLVNKSTVPVGTADRIREIIHMQGLEGHVHVASNPEFLRQGSAVRDTLYPDRIVVGGGEYAARTLRKLYEPLIGQRFAEPPAAPRKKGMGDIPFIAVDLRSAELAKYAANAFLAMKISFINEMANVCDRVQADVTEIARIIGADPRIGPAFLQAGIGYGGSCFPKDTGALRHIADTNGYEFKLLDAVIRVNREQKFRPVEKLKRELGDIRGKKIAVLGLTFKPETDDMRDAPSIPILEKLAEEGASVYAHDPVGMGKAATLIHPDVQLCTQAAEALRDAEAALLLTEWSEYTSLDPAWLRSVMKRPLLIDGRNAYDAASREAVEYRGIGIASNETILASIY